MADTILEDMLIETSPIANATNESGEYEYAKVAPANYLFRPGRIPRFLTSHVEGDVNHFVMYAYEFKSKVNNKTGEVTKAWTKIPHAIDGGPTSATGYVKKRNPDGTIAKSPDGSDELIDMTHTWLPFKIAVDALCDDIKGDGKRKFDGIGYVLTGARCEDSTFVVIDLDHCLDANGALMSKDVQKILDLFKGAHVEVSPSGSGLHVWAWVPGLRSDDIKGNRYKLPDGYDVEVYFEGRYITLTGNVYGGDEARVWERLDQTKQVKLLVDNLERIKRKQAAEKALKENTLTKTSATHAPAKSVDDKRAVVPRDLQSLPDAEVVERAGKVATYGTRFQRLYAGDTTGYSSRSEAALAFFNFLPFWTRGDADQMLRIFEGSGLHTGPDDVRKAVNYDIPKALEGWDGKYYIPDFHKVTPKSGNDDLINGKTMKNASESPSKPSEKPVGKPYTDNYTNFTDQPVRLRCGDWFADDDGVYRVVPHGKSSKTEYAAKIPFMPCAILTNKEERGQKVRLWYSLNGKGHYINAPREVLANSSKIIDLLAHVGINGITSNTAKAAVQYVDDVLSLNSPKTGLKDLTSVSHLGWVNIEGKWGFAPYSDELVTELETEEITLDDLKTRGTLKAWTDAAAKLRMLPFVRVALAVSFAAPLVKLLDVQNGIVHFFGQTGYGKTAILDLAASVWGKPKKLVRSLNTTPYAAMVRSAVFANMPVFFDELQTARSKNGYDSLIYNLVEGQSRGQGKKDGGNKKPLHWNTFFFTTGEDSIISANSQGGAVNRVLDVEVMAPMFNDPGRRELLRVMCRNSGQAGQAYINYITTMWSLNKLQQRYELYMEYFSATSTCKQAALGALLCLGDQIAQECFWPAETENLTGVLTEYLKNDTQVDASVRAYRYVVDKIAANRVNFQDLSKVTWGKFPEKDGGAYDYDQVYINRTTLEELLNDGGFDFRAVKRSWAERGWLVKTSTGKYAHHIKVDGVKSYYVLLSIK